MLVVRCMPATTSDIVGRADEMPGVIKIEASEVEGDDAIPGQIIPKEVKIVMRADSSAAQIRRVLDRYDDDIDKGEVDYIDLFLKGGGKPVNVTIGEGVHLARAQVQELADVMRDRTVIAYYRKAVPVLPRLGVELQTTGLPAVLAAADRFSEHGPLSEVEVKSGDFYLFRDDEGNTKKVAAREQLALAAAQRFRLTGAQISDDGPLRLYVAARDIDAVRSWVQRGAPAAAGRVRVLTGPVPKTAIG